MTEYTNKLFEPKKEKNLTMQQKFNHLCNVVNGQEELDTSILSDVLNFTLALNQEKNKLNQEVKTLKNQVLELKQHVSNTSTRQHVDNTSTTLKPKQRQIPDDDIKYIKRLKSQGLSYKEIARYSKWSTATISRVLNGYYD